MAVLQAHCFYKSLTGVRRVRSGTGDEYKGNTYARAFDSACKSYVSMGFIMDDPARYGIVCATHGCEAHMCPQHDRSCRRVYRHNRRLAVTNDVTGLGRHADYTPPVVHGIPAFKFDKAYSDVRVHGWGDGLMVFSGLLDVAVCFALSAGARRWRAQGGAEVRLQVSGERVHRRGHRQQRRV